MVINKGQLTYLSGITYVHGKSIKLKYPLSGTYNFRKLSFLGPI